MSGRAGSNRKYQGATAGIESINEIEEGEGSKTFMNIRPIATYKKLNPETYKFYNESSMFSGTYSTKQKENNFYWCYAFHNSNIPFKNSSDNPSNFDYNIYFRDYNTMQNIGTITEMGRLLLTGWYYNIVNFTLEVCKNVYNAYCFKVEKGKQFNDLEFAKAVKHIRDNVLYYHHNEKEFKIYLLKHFFEKELTKLLPEPPEKLKNYNGAIEFLKEIHELRLKKDKNWYVKNFNRLEDYLEYLTGILDEYGIEYLSEKEFEEAGKQENEEYWKEIEDSQKEYDEQCKNIILGSNILEHQERKMLT